MKMKMLFACGLCLALTFPLFAQENKLFSQEQRLLDSIYIIPFTGCKIVLVGKRITNMLKENNLEVLKNKLIEDFRESSKEKDFPAESKNVVYLASQDGRRRLKALPDDDLPLNIENEIKSFKNDLPPFHYTIYDLTKTFEYHIYMKDLSDLDKLYKVNIGKMLAEAKAANTSNLLMYSSVEVVKADTSFRIKKPTTKNVQFLVLSPFVGVGLINSNLSPTIGFNADFLAVNKYGKPNFKLGYSLSFNMMADYENKTFRNFYKFFSSDIHYLKNISRSKDEYWLGVSVGRYYTDKPFGSARTGSLDKAWKFGIVNQFKSFGVEYNFIFDKYKNTNSGITLRYYF